MGDHCTRLLVPKTSGWGAIINPLSRGRLRCALQITAALRWGAGGTLGAGCLALHILSASLPGWFGDGCAHHGFPLPSASETLASPRTKQACFFWGVYAVLPFPCPRAILRVQGSPCREVPTGLTFGAGVTAVPGQQCGLGTGGHGTVLLHVLAVHFPHWLPPAVPLLQGGGRRARESSAKVCQVMPRCAPP